MRLDVSNGRSQVASPFFIIVTERGQTSKPYAFYPIYLKRVFSVAEEFKARKKTTIHHSTFHFLLQWDIIHNLFQEEARETNQKNIRRCNKQERLILPDADSL